MAQGSAKFGKSGARKKSAGSQRRKTVKVAKKRNKGSSKVETKDKAIVAATKQINRKNERIIAAKATNSHTKFYLNDLTEKGALKQGICRTFCVQLRIPSCLLCYYTLTVLLTITLSNSVCKCG